MFPYLFSLPPNSLDERPVQLQGPLLRTVGNAEAAVPAFVWKKDNGRASFYWMRDHDVHWTDLNANVTT